VYPSAVHSRFEHSLGALHVADRITVELGFDDQRREQAREAMLLHDVGHGPYSHLFESILQPINGPQFTHETITRWMVDEDPGIASILGDAKGGVLSLLSEREASRADEAFDSLAADVISSGIDADKLDYLRRDSYHIGVAYGSFDLERILHTIAMTPNRKSICIREKGKDAVENYRLGRYLMHAQVYEHHTRIVADQMFVRALDLAINEEGILAKRDFKVGSARNSFESANHKRFMRNYLQLDDSSVYERILQERKKSARILQSIRDRRLLKRACEFEPRFDIEDAAMRHEITKMTEDKMKDFRSHLARRSGVDGDLIIPHILTISVKLYGDEILVMRRGVPVELSDCSPISADPGGITKFFVFCPKGKEEAVAKAAARYWNVPFEKICHREAR
jgi:uncharacterized protein